MVRMGFFKIVNVENPTPATKTFLATMEILGAERMTLPDGSILFYFEELPAIMNNVKHEWTETNKSFDEIREIVLRYRSI